MRPNALQVCEEADVRIAQLHGDGARAALPELHAGLRVVYVMHAEKDGTLCTPLPEGRLGRWEEHDR